MKKEIQYLSKYASAGAINTLLGFFVIFFSMWLGATPIWANILGYSAGIIFGFVASKIFVFKSRGAVIKEGRRYLLAFFASFFCNLVVLKVWLNWSPDQVVAGQIVAAVAYTILMYVFIRIYVFKQIGKLDT